jgi:hypothetical protein
VAAFALERIFDMVSSGTLIVAAILLSPKLRTLPYAAEFRRGALVLIASVVVLVIIVLPLARNGERLGRILRRILSPLSIGLANKTAEITNAFGNDLNMIRDAKSLTQILTLHRSPSCLVAEPRN